MSKRLLEAEKALDKTKRHSLQDAVGLLKKLATAKFDETLECHIRLGVDPKQSDQTVRGTVVLPHGTGKSKKVAVITKGEKIKEAEAAGADVAGSEDLAEKISKGWMDFEVLIASPDMMKELAKLGKILGPKGLMPNPKSGTVTFEVARAVKEFKAGKIEFKMDEYGNLHCPIGKASFDEAKIAENASALLSAVLAAKPASAKGQFLRSVTLSSTMGPGISLDPSQKFSS